MVLIVQYLENHASFISVDFSNYKGFQIDIIGGVKHSQFTRPLFRNLDNNKVFAVTFEIRSFCSDGAHGLIPEVMEQIDSNKRSNDTGNDDCKAS